MGTVIQFKQRRNADLPPRWDRTQRAEIFDQYRDLQAQGFSLRQAAKALEVPRSTLQAWRAYQESLDEHPARTARRAGRRATASVGCTAAAGAVSSSSRRQASYTVSGDSSRRQASPLRQSSGFDR